jgi:hypothetical protein
MTEKEKTPIDKALPIAGTILALTVGTIYYTNQGKVQLREQQHRQEVAATLSSETATLTRIENNSRIDIKKREKDAEDAIEKNTRLDDWTRSILSRYNYHLREDESRAISQKILDTRVRIKKYETKSDMDSEIEAMNTDKKSIEEDVNEEYQQMIEPFLSVEKANHKNGSKLKK